MADDMQKQCLDLKGSFETAGDTDYITLQGIMGTLNVTGFYPC
jgi:hypothetical protein